MILTKIFINDEQIDLNDDVSIPLNFNIADIREPEKRSTTWSKTVVLPGTAFNNSLFSNIWNVNTVINSTGTTNFNPNFNPNLKAKAEITYNNALQFSGIVQLLNVNITDKYEIEYEVSFFGSLQNVYQFFTNRYLRDIDLTEYNHAYTLNNQYLSWYKPVGEGYVYPMIDYGNSINSEFRVEHMYPAIYIKTIIDKMFSAAGYTYQSNFFNSELFKRLILPYNGKSALKLTSAQLNNRGFRASKNTGQQITVNGIKGTAPDSSIEVAKLLTFEDETTSPNFDPGNVFTSNNTFTASKTGVYTILTDITLNVEHYPSTATAILQQNAATRIGMLGIYKNSPNQGSIENPIALVKVTMRLNNIFELVPDEFNIIASNASTITSGTTTDNFNGQLSTTISLNAGETVQVKYWKTYTNYSNNLSPINGYLQPSIYADTYGGTSDQPLSVNSYCKVNVLTNSYFTSFLANTEIQDGDIVDLNYNLPDNIKQSEFFNSIVKMFNLFVEVDKTDSNKLLIEPRTTFYTSGVTRDWSDKLDYSKETKIVPMGELNNKTYLFTYKEDSDFYNNQYRAKYAEIYGEKRYDIQNDFLKGEVKTELIFSPTPLVDTIGHDRVIPKIYTVDSNGQIKPTGSNMRILYYGGLKNTFYPWQHIATSGTTTRNDYPYSGHLDDWQTPTLDLNFGVAREVYFTVQNWTANNLYNKYWKDYIEEISDKDSKLFVGYFNINEFDIQTLDFRDSFYFENEYWRLNKIIDYDRISNQPTKCEFIKLKTIPTYVDDNGFTSNGGVDLTAPNGKYVGGYNGNFYPEGAIVSGRNNNVQSGDGIIVSGNDNYVGIGARNVSITSSSGVTVVSGVENVSVTNSSGITIEESNVTYDNNIKTLNSSTYTYYIALLSQTGTNDPTAIVLENTLSSGITWTYSDVGSYIGTLTGEFTANKTFILHNNTSDGFTYVNRISSNEISVKTWNTSGTAANGKLSNMTIEIRVYS